ncbi:MAG: SIMPL domain-containing protein [Massiliimalia sp.]|jgi:uncharacterized protein YggE
MKRKGKKTAALLAAVMLLGTVSGCGDFKPENVTVTQGRGSVITVTAAESVRTVPDISSICCAVRTEADTAEEAQQKNSAAVEQVLSALRQQGLEESQMQTSGYQLNPQYDYSGDQTQLIGYEMVTELNLSGIAIDQTGVIAGSCVTAGANEIREISYSSSSYDECYREALKKAVESGRKKAEAMAEAEGCKLGIAAEMEEYPADTAFRYETAEKLEMDMASGAGANLAVAPGELEVEAKVTISYEIKD